MTSQIPFISKFVFKHDQLLLTPTSALPNRLLSPITENSAETLSTTLPINQTSSDTSKKSLSVTLRNDNLTIDDLNRRLLERLHQYLTNFHHIQTYLDTLDQHFKGLSIIINCLRNDQNVIDTIQPIEIRLLQMRVKRNEINHLLNQSSIKKFVSQQVCL